jgi:hypothetical protein
MTGASGVLPPPKGKSSNPTSSGKERPSALEYRVEWDTGLALVILLGFLIARPSVLGGAASFRFVPAVAGDGAQSFSNFSILRIMYFRSDCGSGVASAIFIHARFLHLLPDYTDAWACKPGDSLTVAPQETILVLEVWMMNDLVLRWDLR